MITSLYALSAKKKGQEREGEGERVADMEIKRENGGGRMGQGEWDRENG